MKTYFTHYAEKKFEILRNHEVNFNRSQIENVLRKPDKVDKKGKNLSAKKDNVKVVYQKEEDIFKVITFYPVSSE